MSNYRPIELKIEKPIQHWVGNGFRVRQYFPRAKDLFERFSPFILMDYNSPFEFPPSNSPRGIGPHPHRGFETVTFAFEGAVEHHDNVGNHGIIYPGDVQWMTAGKAVLHKEYHEKEFSKKGGVFHMIQLWVNLPAKDKMVEPRYQDLQYDDMGKYKFQDGSLVNIISGKFKNIKGPAKTYSPINIYTIDIVSNEKIELEEPDDFNMGLLILKGDIKINGEEHKNSDFVLFENKKGIVKIQAITETAKIIVLSAQPLNEPIAAGGPFVMNTQEELRQASEDYREGKFGTEDF